VRAGVVPSITASLGNVQTYAAAGLMLRVGDELEADFGPPRMRPSISGSNFYQPDGRWGWYVFAGVEGRAVARDIFLDGNTWRESRSVDREVFVADANAGVAVVMPFARLTVSYTARSREFETQRNSAPPARLPQRATSALPSARHQRTSLSAPPARRPTPASPPAAQAPPPARRAARLRHAPGHPPCAPPHPADVASAR
jgi:Uncharacterized protein conserved in bacteria (DUF2219)